MRLRTTPLAILLTGLLGCGGSSEATSEPATSEVTTGGDGTGSGGNGDEPARRASAGNEGGEAPDGMVVEGLMGSLSTDVIRAEMNEHVARFSRCFEERYPDNELLAGEVELSFRVRMNGHVRSVHLKRSTVGDREVERCLVRVAASLVFSPGPVGGEAEFTDVLGQVVPGELRPPGELSSRRVASLVRANAAAARSACGVEGEGLHATVYVDRRGRVVSVGAAVDAPDQEQALDCLAERIAAWSFPDPGSYDAKATFNL